MLLLHGFPETADAYRSLLLPLAEEGYYAVALSQRGYSPGARPTSLDAYSIEHLATDVSVVADELGADTFHLVGHDWGGVVAWTVAASRPERLTTLTVLSTPHYDVFNDALSDPTSPQASASGYMAMFRAPESHDMFLANDAATFRAIFGSAVPADQVDRSSRSSARPRRSARQRTGTEPTRSHQRPGSAQ